MWTSSQSLQPKPNALITAEFAINIHTPIIAEFAAKVYTLIIAEFAAKIQTLTFAGLPAKVHTLIIAGLADMGAARVLALRPSAAGRM